MDIRVYSCVVIITFLLLFVFLKRDNEVETVINTVRREYVFLEFSKNRNASFSLLREKLQQ